MLENLGKAIKELIASEDYPALNSSLSYVEKNQWKLQKSRLDSWFFCVRDSIVSRLQGFDNRMWLMQ